MNPGISPEPVTHGVCVAFGVKLMIQEMTDEQVNEVSGGDGVMTASGTVVGIVAGALVIGTGGGILIGAALGAAIWGGASYVMENK